MPAVTVLGQPSTKYLDSKIKYFPDQAITPLDLAPSNASTVLSITAPTGYKEISQTFVQPGVDPTPGANKLALLHSSSLVNEPARAEPFYSDINEPMETFIAKRLPNRRWSLTNVVEPFNIQSKHSGSSVNQPPTNDDQITLTKSGQNITTHIIENQNNAPIAVYKYNPKIDGDLRSRSTDNLFQLKRLSNHINSHNDCNSNIFCC